MGSLSNINTKERKKERAKAKPKAIFWPFA
jgi:hypothetical protein